MPNLTPQAAVAELRSMRTFLARAPLTAEMRTARDIIHDSVSGNFANETAPDGPAWAPRKDPGDGHPILHETGALEAAATGVGPGAINDVQGRSVDVGVDQDSVDLGGIPGARAHNEGDPSRNLPQREFMAPTEEALDRIGEVIGDGVAGRLDALLAGGGQ